MIQFLLDIAQFALQALVIVAALLVVIAFIASLISKNKDSQEVKITNLNKSLNQKRRILQKSILDKKAFKTILKSDKKKKTTDPSKPTAFIIDFEGDIKASATDQLRHEITTILMVATEKDQVVVNIESPGGMVHGYGLAASQLNRIKEKNIKLVACVDKVAASGGYMMACVAEHIVAAPFSIIGSIGVIASLPNIHRLLKKNEVDYLEITAGEFKRTLTPLGEITDQKMAKFKEQIEQVHVLFKEHINFQRPKVDIAKVSTGEYWYGRQAIELGLVDELGTSDDHLLKLSETHNVLKIKFEGKKTLKEKLAESMSLSLDKLSTRLWDKLWAKNYEV